jgi:hypothetical protein
VVATELFSRTWGQYTSSNHHTSLRKELTKQLPLKDRKKKKLVRLPNHLGRLRQSLCLNTRMRTGCWRSNTTTTKTEILLFLNLEIFCVFVWLVSLFPVCLFVCVCPSLPVDFFRVFFCCGCFVSFTIVN